MFPIFVIVISQNIHLILLSLLKLLKPDRNNYIDADHDHDHHQVENNLPPAAAAAPSPRLVPLPVQCIAESVKNQLRAVQYREFLKIKTGQSEAEAEASYRGQLQNLDDDSHMNMCIVCMDNMEGSQVVRELCSCSHAFHKECLDVWIDEGQLTCPLCRSELLPNCTPKPKNHKEIGEFEEDPWRAERAVYLFGEDCLFQRGAYQL